MEAASELLIGCHSAAIAVFLPARCTGSLRAAGRGACAELAPHVTDRCSQALQQAVPDAAARAHYCALLGSPDGALALLGRRRWLLEVDAATQFSQWRTETAVARLMNGVALDGSDLFSALKRAFLASQVPKLAGSPCVVKWMHVLGAAEEQDPVQAKLLSSEAWGALAHAVTEENVLWAVQAAHFADALEGLSSWLLVSGGPSASELLVWLRRLERRLRDSPAQGRYGPAGDSSQLRARHVAGLVERLERRAVAAH